MKLIPSVLLLAASAYAAEPALLPLPAKMTRGEGRLKIDGSFRVAFDGFEDARLRAAATRLAAHVGRQTGQLMVSLTPAQPALVVRCNSAGDDESYRLEVSPAHAVLSAANPPGALRGMETLLQLIEPGQDGFGVDSVSIEDRPRFAWRGLMVDCSRHFIPFDILLRTLDAMAAVKLNVFHWHLTDDQGWRLESKRFPELHRQGSDGLYYTQEQVRELVAYAAGRGIRVVPEIEMPGHASAFLVSHPELGSAPGPYHIERTWGVMTPLMDPSNEKLYEMLDGLIGELAALFPDPYIHIGGDEVEPSDWKSNARIQSFMKQKGLQDEHALQAHFNRRIATLLSRHGRRMMGWDEILHPDLPKNIVVHSWRDAKSLNAVLSGGYQAVQSFGFYLNFVLPAAVHYNNEIADGAQGGEACMWAEYISAETIEQTLWPRAAAVAERLWSQAAVKDVDSMYTRLEAVSRKLEFLGLTHRTTRRSMLQRLAPGVAVEPLEAFADALEPIKTLSRYKARAYTQLTPMNRLVDAVRPESDWGRTFAGWVKQRDQHKAELRGSLAAWQGNAGAIRPILASAPLLAEAVPLADSMAEVTACGLQALDYLDSGKAAPVDWLARSRAMLDEAARPKAELLNILVEPVRQLVEAAATR